MLLCVHGDRADLLGTGSPGRPSEVRGLVNSPCTLCGHKATLEEEEEEEDVDLHTVPELCATGRSSSNVALRPKRPYGLLGTGAQDVHLDFHTAPEPL